MTNASPPAQPLTVYVDGSTIRPPGSRRYYQSWALVALGANTEHTAVELSGASLVPKEMDGFHEYVAFLKALELVVLLNRSWHDVIIYTDDQFIAKAPFHLHTENYSAGAFAVKARFTALLPRVLAHFGCALSLDQVLAGLTQARVVSIRSHQGYVYQERVDYLAKRANQTLVATDVKKGSIPPEVLVPWLGQAQSPETLHEPPLPFTEWLAKGIKRFHGATQTWTVRHFPFSDQGSSL